jgi:GT2 family glycosyltransferase
MILRQPALRQLGGFDERIFLYGEDAEICMRAHKLGMRLCYLPLEGVVHAGHGSTGVRTAGTSEVVLFNALSSRIYVARKHLHPSTARLIAWITIAGALYRGVGFVLAGLVAGRPGWRKTGSSYLRAFQRLLRPGASPRNVGARS